MRIPHNLPDRSARKAPTTMQSDQVVANHVCGENHREVAKTDANENALPCRYRLVAIA